MGFLYNMHQKDLALCIADLTKLSILDEPISAKTINTHCFGLGNINIEDFFLEVSKLPEIARFYGIIIKLFLEIILLLIFIPFMENMLLFLI